MKKHKTNDTAQKIRKQAVKLSNSLLANFCRISFLFEFRNISLIRERQTTQLLAMASLCLMVSGCGIYKSNFDCPPGKGVGCASTSEVLDMIVEKQSDSDDPFDSGKNLFVPDTRRKK